MRIPHLPEKSALLCGLVFVCALTACERKSASEPTPLTSKVETIERLAPGCEKADKSNEECTTVKIKREVYGERPALNDAVLKQLLQQLQGNGDSDGRDGYATLEQVADAFIREAGEVSELSSARWQLSGEAKTLDQRGKLLTVVVTSYHYSGGAHGMPVTRWLNWNLQENEPVALADMLRPGTEETFWALAKDAHGEWLDAQAADGQGVNESFRQNWPFTRTEDFRLTDKGLVLLYGVYTLGPYSMGEVELTLPRDKVAELLNASYQ